MNHIAILLSMALAQPPAPPSFIAHTIDGPLSPAPLLQLNADLSVHLGGGKRRQIPGKDLVALRQAGKPLPGFLGENVLILTNGDRIPVDVQAPWRMEQDRLCFQPGAPLRSAKELSLSVSYVSVLCLGQGDKMSAAERDGFLAQLHKEARPRDVVVFVDGDRVEGTLKVLDQANGATLDAGGKELHVPAGRIRAVAFNTEFKARPRTKGPFAHAVLAGGGRLGMQQLRLDPATGMLAGKTAFGGTVEMPLAGVHAITIRAGPAVYLSDLECQFEYTPFLGTKTGAGWPLARDASTAGHALRLGQDTFDKGLGMHSQSRADFQLNGKYRWFETMVGLDESKGRLGRVRLKVLVDGKEQDLGTASLRTWRDGPVRLRINVAQASKLTLVVDFADFGDVQGHVNWGDARLIKQP